MNFDTMFLLFDVFVAGAGVYGLLEWYKMKKSGVLRDCRMIIPANCRLSDCNDPEEFYIYILPRLLGFSTVCLVTGVLSGIKDYCKLLGNLATIVTSAVFFALIVVYGVMIRNAYQRFFQ